MDIDSMVKSMMAAKRVPLDKLNQQKQILQWTRDSYRELNSKLYDFSSNKLTKDYGMSSALNTHKAVVSGNTTAVKAEATASANGINMKVQVDRLATRTTVETSGIGFGKTGKTTLAELDGVDLSVLTESERVEYLNKGFDLTINGVSFKDADGKPLFNGFTSIETMVSTINSNAKAGVIASFDEITGKLILASKTSGALGKVELGTNNSLLNLFDKQTHIITNGAGTGFTGNTTLADLQSALGGTTSSTKYKLNINGQDFEFDSSTAIDQVVSDINNSASAKVIASFDAATGRLSINSTTSDSVRVSSTSDEFMGLFKGINRSTGTNYKQGVDAELFINDQKITKSDNSFVINGVSLTLLSTTNSTDPAKITTETDTEKALDTIKKFVSDYNSVLGLLNSKVGESKYRDFAPLTDEQKKEMKEDDIKAWTEKAKSGLLKNDDLLKSLVYSMRSTITEKLGDLSSIGITTGIYSEGGKLILDETKLKSAISANPQKILDLFQGPAASPEAGLFDKLSEKVNKTLADISERAGTNRFSADPNSTFKEESVMGKKLKDYNKRISDIQKNLVNAENRYYKQFSAMETAMSKLNSQSSNLLSSLGFKQ